MQNPEELEQIARNNIEQRAHKLFQHHLYTVYVRRDHVFAWLMFAQWVFGLLIAFTYSPHGWDGKLQSTHLHVYYAAFVGGLISGSVILLTIFRPGWVVTRHTVAVAQMLWSALIIHLTGGRIESHFHIFGSLAFLAFYRDWRLLVTATMVVVADHLIRGFAWPESVYGIVNPEWWRFLEHAFWVAFENSVLIVGILQNLSEMKVFALADAEMSEFNTTVEQIVIKRTEELEVSREQYRSLVENTQTIPWQWSVAESRFTYVGPQGATLLGCSIEDWMRPDFIASYLHPDDMSTIQTAWDAVKDVNVSFNLEYRLRRTDGTYVTVRSFASNDRDNNCLRGFLLDITEVRRLEAELYHAQKLESVGRLASGVAHEINTPIQFVSDSVNFVREAFSGMTPLLRIYKELHAANKTGSVSAALLEDIDQAEEEADLDYVIENLPKALERSMDGLARVATLVRSMKEFAHPDQKEKTSTDLNHAIDTTLTIARNEYKYVADVETDFGELPPILCHVSQLNQVFLNIIVNAAHAIGDIVRGSEKRGTIRVTTRADGDNVVVKIADTGGGIPENIRSKIFEPFFTTKEVGKGTGQGLSIARSVIVDKHAGTLTFESEIGVGTTFIIRLPVNPDAPVTVATEAA